MHTRKSDASRRSVLRSIGAAGVGVSIAAMFGGCSPRSPGVTGEGAKLNFYNLDSFLGPTTLADFHAAHGIDVNMSLFTSYEEMYAKLENGNPGFDLIMASNETAQRMIENQMLQPLDHGQLPNFSNLSLEFQDAPYDRGRAYTAPYAWQVLGIGYRKSRVDGAPDSWKWLLDSDKYAGRIGVISAPRDLVRCCAKYLGRSANAIADPTLAQIEALLMKQRPFIKAFHQDNGQDLLFDGDVDLVIEYNNDIARVIREDGDLGFALPKEGSLLRTACLCIPASAQRPGNAHSFINYVLDAQIGASIAKAIGYSTPNAAALALTDAKYQDNAALYPPPALLEKCEYGLYEGEARAQVYADLVARVRAAPATPPPAPPPKPALRDPSKEAYVPPPVVTVQGSP